MPYVSTFNRNQMMMCSWDSFVDPESIARLIDAFVNSLDLTKYEVKEAAKEGRPAYDPKGMYKLYIYGNRKGIRSSRKLAESCKVNLEVKWMLGGVEPDFRTISDFRKDNIDSLKDIFHEFNRRISGAVEWGFSSVDGSKFLANNSKDSNFTKNKLDDRIKWLNAHTDEYLRILKEMDEQEELEEIPEKLTREVVEAKLKEAQERLARYESYQKLMEETGASQLSLTDADARLMKNKNGFAVAYNPQTAVDSETHLIRNFKMTNQVTDHGMLNPTMEEIREETQDEILEVVADKGYENEEDMIKCLENGMIPHVILDDGKDGYELEISYEEAEADITSTKPEELKKSLHAGKIPEAYKDVISDMEVKEVRRKVKEDLADIEKSEAIYGTPEEMLVRAKEGYFVRDPERNLVYCPEGEVLRQKCIKKNGNIRYANKNACKHCRNRNKCYKGKGEWKEIDFTKDTLEKPCKEWLKAEGKECENAKQAVKGHFEKVKVVKFFLKPSFEKMSQRMCLSEHPFGTIKRAMGATYFLLKGLRKVTGEFALFCLGYNMERAKNLLGFEKMMQLMATA
ncbi:transposase [Mediterraneibacter faecis]|uniref:Transposase n=1 Tax=Streptococcus alactolyticus TaxID=29389 RepID=A0ABY7LZ92_STRAY|nr:MULTISPECIES: transposase [Bacillota]MCI6043549.1 transposase [bacterium]MCI6430771.1 transposase [Lachnospiraceae bacterium]MDY2594534.1 transposase [Oliverpabstia sp.]MCI6920336.1 transposase [Lachnospiraceae bacterium]MCI7721500.1 transposase [Mediterraneibacter faecis]